MFDAAASTAAAPCHPSSSLLFLRRPARDCHHHHHYQLDDARDAVRQAAGRGGASEETEKLKRELSDLRAQVQSQGAAAAGAGRAGREAEGRVDELRREVRDLDGENKKLRQALRDEKKTTKELKAELSAFDMDFFEEVRVCDLVLCDFGRAVSLLLPPAENPEKRNKICPSLSNSSCCVPPPPHFVFLFFC